MNDLYHKIVQIRNEAEIHRHRYSFFSGNEMQTSYWKGRRDEAGHFRDRLNDALNSDVELPDERLEILEYI
jgi:hypothetical protein